MKTDLIQLLNSKNTKKSTVDIRVGDTVRVHTKIKEGNKERVQVYEGVVIGIRHGKGVNGTFTVRKISYGIGVERVFPLHSPNVVKVEVKKRAKVRRAKLTYLRALTGKKARLKETKFDSLVVNTIEEELEVVEVEGNKEKEKSENQEAPEVKAEEAEDKEVQEDTEVNPETQEDEAAIAEESTEDLAKKEVKESEKVHHEEEEAGREDDESNLPEEEVEEGIEKAEDQDTRAQEDKG